MSRILSLEHCARITTWDDARRRLHMAEKAASRTRLAVFLAFNVVIWGLLLGPILLG